jgi:hypothetical protein
MTRVVGNEGPDGGRVKLGAGRLAKNLDRPLVSRRAAVGTRRGDRVKRIRHRNDARPERDLVPP